MSYDLAVWVSDRYLTAAEAALRYQRLEEHATGLDDVDPRVEGFLADMTACYPPLESLSDDEVDDSPWSSAPSPGADYVHIAVVWSRATEVFKTVQAAASRWDLVLYEPGSGNVYHPPTIARTPAFLLSLEDGTLRADPTPAELAECLARVRQGRNSFAILERQDGHFMQAQERKGALWVLEWQRGGLDQHFVCSRRLTRENIVTALSTFLMGHDQTIQELGWDRIDVS